MPCLLYLYRRTYSRNVESEQTQGELGVNIPAIDYRGFGSSTPLNLTENTANEDAVRLLAISLFNERSRETIILTGWSPGTGPATEIAKEYSDIGGLVLVSPYTALPDLLQYSPDLW